MTFSTALNTVETDQILISVERRTHGAIVDLDVSIVDNIVVLSGRTTTYYLKQLATEAAKSNPDALELSNQIRVMNIR
jgi:hypothetical protein